MKTMYTVEIFSNGELVKAEKYTSFKEARIRVTQFEKVAHKTHSLLNVVLIEDNVKLLERFFG